MFYIFGTQMERSLLLTDLHKGILPKSFQQQYPEESHLILWMCSINPEDRPICEQLLRQSYFRLPLISPLEFHSLKKQLEEIEQANRQLKEQNKNFLEKLSSLSNVQRHLRARELELTLKDKLLEEQAIRIKQLEKERDSRTKTIPLSSVH